MNDLLSSSELEFVLNNLEADVDNLALKLKPKSDFRPVVVLRQIEGKRLMQKKLPSWSQNPNIVYPSKLPLEQCSSSFTADYKKGLVLRLTDNQKFTFVDLTSGFGVDFSTIASAALRSVYVERQSELCEIANHNFKFLNISNYQIINTDGVDFLKNCNENFDVIYLDPARRSKSGGKIFRIEDCEPNLIEIQDLLLSKSKFVIAKLSPMLDIEQCVRSLRNLCEVHIISHNGECKEILAVLINDKCNLDLQIFAVDDYNVLSFDYNQIKLTKVIDYALPMTDNYLYEPNSSLMKASCFGLISQKFNLKKIAKDSHLFVSENLVENFMGRVFLIKRVGSVRDFSNIKKANITVRNFPTSVESLRKKLKISDGGDIYIFATTDFNGNKILIETAKVLSHKNL